LSEESTLTGGGGDWSLRVVNGCENICVMRILRGVGDTPTWLTHHHHPSARPSGYHAWLHINAITQTNSTKTNTNKSTPSLTITLHYTFQFIFNYPPITFYTNHPQLLFYHQIQMNYLTHNISFIYNFLISTR